jgi:hypothetical protein
MHHVASSAAFAMAVAVALAGDARGLQAFAAATAVHGPDVLAPVGEASSCRLTDAPSAGGPSAAGSPPSAPRSSAGPAANDLTDGLLASALALRAPTWEEAALVSILAGAAPELSRAERELSPLRVDRAEPRAVATTFGWLGAQYPVRHATGDPAGTIALWFDGVSHRLVAEARFVIRSDALEVRIVVDDATVFADVLADTDIDAEGFWKCLNQCTENVLSHWAYTLIRAVCTRLCVPITPYCAPCVIALSALEAGMISGCVHECAAAAPGSGSWSRPREPVPSAASGRTRSL